MQSDARDIDTLLVLARAANERGDTRAALEVLERIERTHPTNPHTLTRMGFAYLSADQFAAAIDAFDRAATVDDAPAAAHSGRGQALQALGRLEEAEKSLQKALEIAPTSSRWVLLGDVQAALVKDSLAEAAFRKALVIDPLDDEALFNLAVLVRDRDSESALALLKQATEIDPLGAAAHRELGLELLRSGRVHEAEHEIESALQLDDQDSWALIYLGHLYWSVQRHDDAAAMFRRASEVSPLWSVPEYLLGKLEHERHKHKDAEVHFDRAVQLDPQDANAAFNFGRFLTQVGRHEEGRAWVHRALQIDPEHRRASEWLRRIEGSESPQDRRPGHQ